MTDIGNFTFISILINIFWIVLFLGLVMFIFLIFRINKLVNILIKKNNNK